MNFESKTGCLMAFQTFYARQAGPFVRRFLFPLFRGPVVAHAITTAALRLTVPIKERFVNENR